MSLRVAGKVSTCLVHAEVSINLLLSDVGADPNELYF